RDPSVLQVELWDANRSLVLTIPEGSSPVSADLEPDFKQSAADPFRVLGALRSVKDTAIYPVIAAVRDDAGAPIGYLVRWRRMSPTSNVRKHLPELIGSQATVYYGNMQGDVCTDLEKIVPKTPIG